MSLYHFIHNSSRKEHEKTRALLEAIDQTIIEQGHEPVPATYLASIMLLLQDGTYLEQEENVTAIITLLSVLLQHQETPVLLIKSKGPILIELIQPVLETYEDKTSVLRLCMSCLTKVICLQASSFFQPIPVIIGKFLAWSCDSRPKIRQQAVIGISEILKSVPKPLMKHPCIGAVTKWIEQYLEQRDKEAVSRKPFILTLLKSLIGIVDCSALKKVIQSVMDSGEDSSTAVWFCIYQIISETWQHEQELVSFLADRMVHVPTHDEALLLGWLKSWHSILGSSVFVPIFNEKVLEKWIELFSMSSSNHFSLLSNCLILIMKRDLSTVPILLKLLQQGFNWRYKLALESILLTIQSGFQVAEIVTEEFDQVIVLLDKLKTDKAIDKHTQDLISNVLICSCSCVGLKRFLSLLPLNLYPRNNQMPRAWLLTLLSECEFKSSSLEYFCVNLIPIANGLKEQGDGFIASGKEMDAKVHHTLNEQIWAIFPAICAVASDVNFFGNVAKQIAQTLNDQPNIRVYVCSGLSHLFKNSQVAGYSRQYLPLLFNLYLAEEQVFVLNLINKLVVVSDQKSILFKNILKKILESNESKECSKLWALAFEFLPYCQDQYERIYSLCINRITKSNDQDEVKFAYKALSLMMSAEFLSDHDQLISILSQHQTTGRHRLKIISSLIANYQSNDITPLIDFIPEIVLGVKDASEKARQQAYSALVDAIKLFSNHRTILDKEATYEEYVKVIAAGLAGDTPIMQSASVLALARVVFELKDQLEASLLVDCHETVLALGQTMQREVLKSCVAWIKVSLVVLKKESLKPFLSHVIDLLLKDPKGKSRMKFLLEKLVRKFSFEEIEQVMPDNGMKVLVAMKKRKKAKSKEEKREQNEEQDDIDVMDQFNDLEMGEESDFSEDDLMLKRAVKRTNPKETLPLDENGRLIVVEELLKEQEEEEEEDNPYLESKRLFTKTPRGKIKFSNKRDRDEQTERIKRPNEDSKPRVADSKRFKGDARRSGDAFEPFAYIPLNSQMAGKRKQAKAQGKMRNIINAAKKGARK